MTSTCANDPAIAGQRRTGPPGASAADAMRTAGGGGGRPSCEEIADVLARLHATHAALGAAQYRISQLVQANQLLEGHARALAKELDHTRRLALHDPLTGLANRALLGDRLELAIRVARREESHVAVLMLDLDGFKAINDGYGHAAGDEVLCEAARRTTASIRSCDTACRYGGDEFVIILSSIDKRDDAETVADKIRAEIARPLVLADRTLAITATLGMSLYPTDGQTADQLLEHADRAMYGTRARNGAADGTRLLHAPARR